MERQLEQGDTLYAFSFLSVAAGSLPPSRQRALSGPGAMQEGVQRKARRRCGT